MYGKVVASIAGFLVVGAVLTQAFPSQMNSLFGNDAAQAKSEHYAADMQVLAMEIHNKVNQARVDNGVAPLEWESTLAEVATKHSADMAANGYFDHKNLVGQGPTERAKAGGFSCYKPTHFGIGENLHQDVGFMDLSDYTVNGWLNSPEHRDNLLSPNYTKEGIGIDRASDGKVYVTQDLC